MQCKGNGISNAPLLAAERLEEFAPFSAGGRAVPLARSGDEVAAGDGVEAFFWGGLFYEHKRIKNKLECLCRSGSDQGETWH
jgi:hypothetical protein